MSPMMFAALSVLAFTAAGGVVVWGIPFGLGLVAGVAISMVYFASLLEKERSKR